MTSSHSLVVRNLRRAIGAGREKLKKALVELRDHVVATNPRIVNLSSSDKPVLFFRTPQLKEGPRRSVLSALKQPQAHLNLLPVPSPKLKFNGGRTSSLRASHKALGSILLTPAAAPTRSSIR